MHQPRLWRYIIHCIVQVVAEDGALTLDGILSKSAFGGIRPGRMKKKNVKKGDNAGED